MFARAFKVPKKSIRSELRDENYCKPELKRTQRKHTIQSLKKETEPRKKSKFNIFLQESPFLSPKPSNNNQTKIINFQNAYIKSLTGKESDLDERRQSIKQKIKGKVKQQLADLIKRTDFARNSMTQVRIKDQIDKSALDVSIRGSSIQRTLKTCLSHRPQISRFQRIRRLNHQKNLMKKTEISDKAVTADSSPRQKAKGRRSLSHVIRVHNTSPRKIARNIHSALCEMRMPEKKDSVQIEPWQQIQDY